MKVRDIQIALAAAGMVTGPIDGIWGRQTIAAVRAFQRAKGLEVDGIVGPMTLAALFPVAAPATGGLDDPRLVWFKEALRLQGTREVPASGNNPEILQWATNLEIDYGSDDIAWCGLFVGHCVASTLDREPMPTNILRARAWGRFGIPTAPTPGAIMVFWRESRQSGLGHVGFYAGEDDTAYRIVGGNQSNSVSLAWIGKDRFIDARWPATVAAPVPGKVFIASREEPLSWDEA